MPYRVLHVLSQRPGRTGSGVTLDAVVREAARRGWRQVAVVGVPADETAPAVGDLPAAAVRRVTFAPVPGAGAAPPPDLPFPVPGMSDVMPYPSSVWSALTPAQLDLYRTAWRRRLAEAVADFGPDLVQTNHVWLVSALLKDLAPALPVVATCHATGLRQLDLCPHLAGEVVAGCRRLDRFAVLREDHRAGLAARLGVPAARIHLVGTGFRDDVFGGPPAADDVRRDQLLYAGKSSRAKGLPWLLDAVQSLAPRRPGLRLHVAGGGAGPEADALQARLAAMAPLVVRHGPLDQPALAALMRRCAVAVLPSFYEGVPLVLAEAAPCTNDGGNRLAHARPRLRRRRPGRDVDPAGRRHGPAPEPHPGPVPLVPGTVRPAAGAGAGAQRRRRRRAGQRGPRAPGRPAPGHRPGGLRGRFPAPGRPGPGGPPAARGRGELPRADAGGRQPPRTDPVLPGRILGDMVKNALEAVPEDATVTLDSGRSAGSVWFAVHNPGSIPAADLPRQFTRSFSTKGKGRGLGTWSTRILAETYLRGRVAVASDAARGTTFTLTLPAGGP